MSPCDQYDRCIAVPLHLYFTVHNKLRYHVSDEEYQRKEFSFYPIIAASLEAKDFRSPLIGNGVDQNLLAYKDVLANAFFFLTLILVIQSFETNDIPVVFLPK